MSTLINENVTPTEEVVVNPNSTIHEFDTPAYRPRKKCFGDRKEGRRLRTLKPMFYVIPFIMKERNDSQNQFEDVIDITNIERYLDKKHQEGFTDMTILHVIFAAYCRVIADRPAINRFIAGRRIYARNNIECVMEIKREFTIQGDERTVKLLLDPRDNIYNVYHKFKAAANEALKEDTDFDKVTGLLAKLPRFVFRGAMAFLRWLDFNNMLPKMLMNVSPFHGSMILTSMGSLGIPAIYHHLYDFGTLPVFVSYGSIFTADAIKRDGTRERHHFVTLKVVTDERICDGYYYASAFKRMKKYLNHPEFLDKLLDTAAEDID